MEKLSFAPHPEPPMLLNPKFDFWGVLSESKQIIKSHPRHFLALSFLFIFPISFSSILYQTYQHHQLTESKNSITYYIHTVFSYTLSPCAVGTITYSVLHGFYGQPVKLSSAIKSLSSSLLPDLLVTHNVSRVVRGVGFVIYMSFLWVVTTGIQFLGVDVSITSLCFVGLSVVGLVLGLVYLEVNWALASVVVVAESSWWCKPFIRSAKLVTRARGIALCLMLYELLRSFLGWSFLQSAAWLGSGSGWRSWAIIALFALTSTLEMMLLLHSIVAHVVLYVHCKSMNGELSPEIAKEFDQERNNKKGV